MQYNYRNNGITKSILFIISLLFLANPQIKSQPQSQVKHPEWSYNQTIYEVNLRQYSKEGTFKEFETHLPELKKMGVGIIWLMPINPIGEKNRKGPLGSYYSVKNYKTVNPDYGTLADFKEVVNKIHKLGMYVIIDWVANHTSWDNVLVKEHPDFYKKDSAGNFIPPVEDWSDVIALDYSNKNLWDYMAGAMKYWIKQANIDGFRCDVAGMVPTDFWNYARQQLDEVKPVFMLAEAEDPGLQIKAFDMTYSWELYQIQDGIAQGKKNVQDIINYFNKENNEYPESAFRMRFTSNHDENSWNGTVKERLGNAAPEFAAFTVVIPGMPLLYSGQEAGLNKRLEFFKKDVIEWKDSPYRELYTKLFNLKMNNEALLNGEKGGKVNLVSPKESKNIYAFTRESGGDKILAVFNFSKSESDVNLKGETLHGSYSNLITGEKAKFSDEANMKLKPWGFNIFVKEK